MPSNFSQFAQFYLQLILNLRGFVSVRCYPRYDDATNATVIQTSELSATFKGLKPSTDYAIQVRAKTTRGWGEYTPVVYKKTPHAMGLGDYSNSFDQLTRECDQSTAPR